MKTIKNDYCIRMFTGNDNLRPALTKVSRIGDCTYATNGHIAAKVKSDLCVHEYEEVEKYPNVEKVISDHVSSEKKVVSADILLGDMMRIECCFKPKMINCNDCGGEGNCTCDHCDSEYECKKCKGTGEVAGPEIELSGEYNCILFNRKYKLSFLDIVVRTMIFTGVKEVEISNGKTENSSSIFYVGDFTILLMPLL